MKGNGDREKPEEERETELPEFREEKEIAPTLKPRTITLKMAQEIGRREIEKKYPHFFED